MKLHLNIPDSLDDITLEEYQKFEKVNTEENKDSVFLMQKMVEIFCKVDLDLTRNIKYKDLIDIVTHLNNLLTSKPELITTFKLDGIQFGFIPDLDNITLGEYIDLDNYLGSWENMHKAMSVLYRPIKLKKDNRYLIENYSGAIYDKQMLKSPLSVVISSQVFFYNLSKELLVYTLKFLEKELGENLTQEQLKTLEKNGDGITQCMDSLAEILKELNISQN
tara:strand:+ start:4518 stop:5180 length:663 start_codon:yes stop_codon:yes gene_type:complete